MISYKEIEKVLQTYTLEEILEHNEITEEELLYILIEEHILELPAPKPIDVLFR